MHMAASPGLQLELTGEGVQKFMRLASFAQEAAAGNALAPSVKPQPHDHRFASEGWKQYPFNVFAEAFLLGEEWWHSAMTSVRGAEKHNLDRVDVYLSNRPIIVNLQALVTFAWSSGNMLEFNIGHTQNAIDVVFWIRALAT